MDTDPTVLHWYDLLCPFCYLAQQWNAALAAAGVRLVELPFEIHPEIPPEGIEVGARAGPMYELLAREAAEAGLPLRWPPRLPSTRRALAVAEWTRQTQPDAFPGLRRSLFAAHFALGEDLGDPAVLDRHAREAGVELPALRSALEDGSALREVTRAESLGRALGVTGTPAWHSRARTLVGLRSLEELLELVRAPDGASTGRTS